MDRTGTHFAINTDTTFSSELPEQQFLPDAYRLPDNGRRGPTVASGPKVVFIEVTNRCNLLCQTCTHTYFEREPLKSLSLNEFISTAEQFLNYSGHYCMGLGNLYWI